MEKGRVISKREKKKEREIKKEKLRAILMIPNCIQQQRMETSTQDNPRLPI